MANNQIKLIDQLSGEIKAFEFDQSDTIGDLKRKIAQKENYQRNADEIKIRLSFIHLKNEFMVKDFVDLEDHGLFVEFPSYPVKVTANKDIKVWLGKRDCKQLKAGSQETFQFSRKGKFAVTRNE